MHCLGARAGLPYQVNDRLPRFAVCPVQLEGAATTPALLLPFPSPPLCCCCCWAATSICSLNDDTPDLEFPPGVPFSRTCRPEACDFCHSTHTPRKGQFTCEREGSSQVLSRGSIRGQIAQGTYTIALCGGGTAEGYASLHVCVCVSLLSLACLLGGSAIAHSTASCFLPLLLEKDFRPPKGVIPNAKQHWRQLSFLACIFNPPCATEVAFWFFLLSSHALFPLLGSSHTLSLSFSRLHPTSVLTPPITPYWNSTLSCLSSPLSDQTPDRVHTTGAQWPLQALVV